MPFWRPQSCVALALSLASSQALTMEAELDESVSLPAVPSTRVTAPQAAQPAAAAPAKKGPMTEEEELMARAANLCAMMCTT